MIQTSVPSPLLSDPTAPFPHHHTTKQQGEDSELRSGTLCHLALPFDFPQTSPQLSLIDFRSNAAPLLLDRQAYRCVWAFVRVTAMLGVGVWAGLNWLKGGRGWWCSFSCMLGGG